MSTGTGLTCALEKADKCDRAEKKMLQAGEKGLRKGGKADGLLEEL